MDSGFCKQANRGLTHRKIGARFVGGGDFLALSMQLMLVGWSVMAANLWPVMT
jgi:hypothetical protein